LNIVCLVVALAVALAVAVADAPTVALAVALAVAVADALAVGLADALAVGLAKCWLLLWLTLLADATSLRFWLTQAVAAGRRRLQLLADALADVYEEEIDQKSV
jgi:hypothetical protein